MTTTYHERVLGCVLGRAKVGDDHVPEPLAAGVDGRLRDDLVGFASVDPVGAERGLVLDVSAGVVDQGLDGGDAQDKLEVGNVEPGRADVGAEGLEREQRLLGLVTVLASGHVGQQLVNVAADGVVAQGRDEGLHLLELCAGPVVAANGQGLEQTDACSHADRLDPLHCVYEVKG